MKLYLAGPMRGIPEFNFPAFHQAARLLRAKGHTVFNPAERDIERHGGVDISKGNLLGSVSVAAADHGFNLREALGEDLAWICAEAEGIALMRGFENSMGARAELATANALGLRIVYSYEWED